MNLSGVLTAMVGSIPQWLMLLTLVVTAWKLIRNTDGEIRKELIGRVEQLKNNYNELKAACDTREEALEKRITELQKQLNNEILQQSQRDISLVSTLIELLPGPQLHMLLEALRAKQSRLPQVLFGVEGDADKEGAGNAERS